MANVRLKFYGTTKSETDEHSLTAYANIHKEIYLRLEMPHFEDAFICLDKLTAVALVRELKKQIGFIESEVSDD